MREAFENINDANERLKYLLKEQTQKAESANLAYKIEIKESRDSFKKAESERLRLQEENKNLHHIYKIKIRDNDSHSGVNNIKAKKVSTIEVDSEDEENDDIEDEFIKNIQQWGNHRRQGFNRSEGPATQPMLNNHKVSSKNSNSPPSMSILRITFSVTLRRLKIFDILLKLSPLVTEVIFSL